MKKLMVNEEILRIKQMMGIKESSTPTDEIIDELSPADIVGSVREEEGDENSLDSQTDLMNYLYNKYDLDELETKVFIFDLNPKYPIQTKEVDDFWSELTKDQETPYEIPGFEGTMDKLNDISLSEGESKEEQLKVAFAAFDKAEMSGDIRGQELALAVIDLIRDSEDKLNVSKEPSNESFDPSDAYSEYLSDCCGAPMYTDMGICSDCKEHCEPQSDDELDMSGIDSIEKELEEEEQSWMAMRSGKEGKIYENKAYEGRAYVQEDYFDTQSGALESAQDYALNKGYEADMASFYPVHIKYGETANYHVELSKNDKPVKNKMLHISLYRMDSGKYELTNYIN